MPKQDKPYRVYRGGRSRRTLRVPAQPGPPPVVGVETDDAPWNLPPEQLLDPGAANGEPREPAHALPPPPSASPDGGAPPLELVGPPPTRPRAPRRRRRAPAPPPRRRIVWRIAKWALALALLGLLLVVGWGVFGYFTLRAGLREANDRLEDGVRAALTPAGGSIVSTPTTTLVLGIDTGAARSDSGRSDAIVLVRTDPENHTVSLLSVPRDLRVEIPGHGLDKVNAAYALGGAPLTIATVQRLLGDVGVNHVAIVDFDGFARLIDRLGGVTVDIPRRIVSNRFDCPFASVAECNRWQGWRFEPGTHTLDGRRALVYSRVRENRQAPDESDITRGGRQQQVLRAMVDDLVGVDTFVRLPLLAGDLTAPLATDLSATDVYGLGWVELRSPPESTIRCRLGGTPVEIGGTSYLAATEENGGVVSQFLGRSAPQPPREGDGPFAPGCVRG